LSRRILIVDDSPSLRRMVALTLKGAGYDVTEAGDGQDAREHVKAEKFDVILTDQNMPRMDGLAFIREYRKRPDGQGVPIVFLSTENEGSLKDSAREAGATGWMTKPFDQAKLLSVMSRLTGA